jgi:hypothetical protein
MKKKQTIFLPLVLATLLAVGFIAVVAGVLSWISSMATSGRGYREYENLVVKSDGTPIIASYNNETWQEVYRTLDGQKLDKEAAKSMRTLFAAQLMGARDIEAIQTPLAATERVQPEFDLACLFNQSAADEGGSFVYWYFMHDGKREGKGYFAGFDRKSKQSVGYLGREGFCKEVPPQERRFPMDGRLMGPEQYSYGMLPRFYKNQEPSQNEIAYPLVANPAWKTLMISGDDLLQIDLKTGKTTSLLKAPGMLSLSYIGDYRIQDPKENDDLRHGLAAVRTADRIIICESTGKTVETFAIPESLRGQFFSFYHIGKDQALINKQKHYVDAMSTEELLWTDSAGKILRRREVELAGRTTHGQSQADYWFGAIFTQSPLVMSIFGLLISPWDDVSWMGGELSYVQAMRLSWVKLWMPLGALVIVAGALAFLCYRRQRRYAQPWTWIWVIFVFLLGLPGYIGYRFHRRWAVLETCPNCKHVVPRDREACAACGRQFPLPDRKGIEVFA